MADPKIVKEIMGEMNEQRFWEKCGLEDVFEGDTGAHYWKAPNGDSGVDLPPIDLNNLFKYAVPKIPDLSDIMFSYTGGNEERAFSVGENECIVVIWMVGKTVEGKDKDPADALYWAISKALGVVPGVLIV